MTTALRCAGGIFTSKIILSSSVKRFAAVSPKDDSPGCDFPGVLDHFLRGLDSRDFTQVTVQVHARKGKQGSKS